jgi:hypothetical protein
VSVIVDHYHESNHANGAYILGGTGPSHVGQSFTGDGGNLSTCKFYLVKSAFNSPTGNVYAYVYAHTGTFGTSSLPTGSALATSGAVDVSTLSTDISLVTFTFSGDDKITLTNGTKYVVTVGYGGEVSVNVGIDFSSPTHGGNIVYYQGGEWLYDIDDAIFYVYRDDAPACVVRSLYNTNTLYNDHSLYNCGIDTPSAVVGGMTLLGVGRG